MFLDFGWEKLEIRISLPDGFPAGKILRAQLYQFQYGGVCVWNDAGEMPNMEDGQSNWAGEVCVLDLMRYLEI